MNNLINNKVKMRGEKRENHIEIHWNIFLDGLNFSNHAWVRCKWNNNIFQKIFYINVKCNIKCVYIFFPM